MLRMNIVKFQVENICFGEGYENATFGLQKCHLQKNELIDSETLTFSDIDFN